MSETGLRDWARGDYTYEAAVEVVLAAPRLSYVGAPWIRPAERGGVWLDVDSLIADSGVLSGQEQALARIAAAFIRGREYPVALGDEIVGLDHTLLGVVAKAVIHAGGVRQDWESASST